MKLGVLLLLISLPCSAQDIEFRLGIGKPIFNNDIRDSKKRLWRQEFHTIISAQVILPFKYVDVVAWHHSILEDNNDTGVSGVSIFIKKKVRLW